MMAAMMMAVGAAAMMAAARTMATAARLSIRLPVACADVRAPLPHRYR
jgi:hypothetical protein